MISLQYHIMEEDTFKNEESLTINNGKEGKMSSLKRIIAIALIILGGYYLFISIEIIPSNISFGDFIPTSKQLLIISVIIIVLGLLIDDRWREKIMGSFQ